VVARLTPRKYRSTTGHLRRKSRLRKDRRTRPRDLARPFTGGGGTANWAALPGPPKQARAPRRPLCGGRNPDPTEAVDSYGNPASNRINPRVGLELTLTARRCNLQAWPTRTAGVGWWSRPRFGPAFFVDGSDRAGRSVTVTLGPPNRGPTRGRPTNVLDDRTNRAAFGLGSVGVHRWRGPLPHQPVPGRRDNELRGPCHRLA